MFVVKELTQITVIVAWLIEIYLNQLNELNEQKNYDDYHIMHREFYKFLDNNKIKVFEHFYLKKNVDFSQTRLQKTKRKNL